MSLVGKSADFDILQMVGDYYYKIPAIWRRAFFITFFINCVVFASAIINPPIGNHDWNKIPWIHFLEQLKQGRWFDPVILTLFGHIQVPVVNHVAAIAFNVAAGMAAIVLWKKDKSISVIVFLTCIVTLAPFVLFQYYYRHVALIFPASALMGVLGLIVARRISFNTISVASLLIMFSIATYQPTVNVIATVFCIYILFEIIEAPWSITILIKTIKEKFLPKILAIIIGSIGYGLSITMLKYLGIVGNPYQLETIAPLEVFGRIGMVVTSPVDILVRSQAFMPDIAKISLLAIVLASLLTVAYKVVRTKDSNAAKSSKTLACVTLFILAFIGTKAMFFVSATGGIHHLKWGYGLAFFYMGCTAALLSYSIPFVKSIAFVLITFVLILFSREDLVFQELMTRSNQHDLAFANRVLFKIESVPGLDFKKRYKYFQIGGYPDYRRERYKTMGHKYDLEPGNQFFASISLSGASPQIFAFLGGKLDMYTKRKSEDGYWDTAKTAITYAEASQPWPHESSVVLKEDTIFVYLDKKALEKLKESYKIHLKKIL